MLKDISTLDDIKVIVDDFYGKIRQDELLKDIFNNIIQNRWPEHLEKMYRFWQTVLLDDERTYFGAPFLPHANLPVGKQHFDRWISLFNTTVDHYYQGQKAERAKWQGERMAEMFLQKINYYQNSSAITLL